MAEKKLYVHFERANYISGKSELLKVQMEILYLKKLIKTLALTRVKKVHYRRMLEDVVLGLKEKIMHLDVLMPEDKEMFGMKVSKNVQHKEVKRVALPRSGEGVVVRKDDVEEELMRIKQKLDSLNRI